VRATSTLALRLSITCPASAALIRLNHRAKFLATILPYGVQEWEKLSIFLNFLIPKLPASVEAPHDQEARQRQLLGQVLGADPGEEDFRVARHLPARR
jgi:hypothetical protein